MPTGDPRPWPMLPPNEFGPVYRTFDETFSANEFDAEELIDKHLREQKPFDVVKHLHDHRKWSIEKFGPDFRHKGLVDHIRKECLEVEMDPTDPKEWIDIAILALDGAMRAGYEPHEVVKVWRAKHDENLARDWPDWRTADLDKAVQHIKREGE